jgi:hypothetical protein
LLLQVVVLFRGSHQPAASFGLLERRRCAVAYASAEKVFGLLTGGSHPVSLDSALELISVMNIVRGSVVWEIGCGVPVLAAAMSSVTRNAVLCTDIGDTFQLLMGVSVTRMGKRIMERSLELATEIIPTRFTDECLDTYVDGLPPFQERTDNTERDDLLDLLTYLSEQVLDAPEGDDVSDDVGLFDIERYRIQDIVPTASAAARAEPLEPQAGDSDDVDSTVADGSDYNLEAYNAFATQDIVVVAAEGRTTRATQAAAIQAAAARIHEARAPTLNFNLLDMNPGNEDEVEDEADDVGAAVDDDVSYMVESEDEDDDTDDDYDGEASDREI